MVSQITQLGQAVWCTSFVQFQTSRPVIHVTFPQVTAATLQVGSLCFRKVMNDFGPAIEIANNIDHHRPSSLTQRVLAAGLTLSQRIR